MIAAFVNEFLGGVEIILRPTSFPPVFKLVPRIRLHLMKQSRPIEMNVRHVQTHRATLGDFPSLIEISLGALGAGLLSVEKAQPSASVEAVWNVILRGRSA